MSNKENTIAIAISGISGRMGREIALAANAQNIPILGALVRPNHPLVESDLSKVIGGEMTGLAIVDKPLTAFMNADVVIDFTNPASALENANYAAQKKKPFVTGTTGFSAQQLEILKKFSHHIPIFYATNMSIGVYVFQHLAAEAARLLKNFDLEIAETHHARKEDAPSGTAKTLFEKIAQARGDDLTPRYGREGMVGKRRSDEVAVLSIRGGDVIGDHSLYLFGKGERLEITHRATNRALFAEGALKAAQFLHDKPTGFYGMADLVAAIAR